MATICQVCIWMVGWIRALYSPRSQLLCLCSIRATQIRDWLCRHMLLGCYSFGGCHKLSLFSIDLAKDFCRIGCPKIVVEGLFICVESGDAACFFQVLSSFPCHLPGSCYLSRCVWFRSVKSPESCMLAKMMLRKLHTLIIHSPISPMPATSSN